MNAATVRRQVNAIAILMPVQNQIRVFADRNAYRRLIGRRVVTLLWQDWRHQPAAQVTGAAWYVDPLSQA